MTLSWLGEFQAVFIGKDIKMHGHKKKKSEWDKKGFRKSPRNMWNLDDGTEIDRNPRKKRRFRYGEGNDGNEDESLGLEDDYEEEQ